MDKKKIVTTLAWAICKHIAKNEPDQVKLTMLGRDVTPIAEAALEALLEELPEMQPMGNGAVGIDELINNVDIYQELMSMKKEK